MGASAYGRGNSPQARTGSSPHDCFDHNVKATVVAVIGGWDHGVAPSIYRWGKPKPLRQEAGRDSTVLRRTLQWPTR